MKRFAMFVLVVLATHSPAWATWTCKDGGAGCTSTTTRDCQASANTTCNITVASTTAGSVGIVCEQVATTAITLTVTGGGTWTTSTASHGTDTTAGGAECAYNLNMTGSTTTVTCTFSATNTSVCTYFNFTGTGSSFTLDTGNGVDDSTACTTCTGVALTLGTSNNYILVQAATCGGTCSAINQSYTGVFPFGDGAGFKINVSSAGTTPSWTQTSGRLAGGAIAIYEIVSATCQNFIALMGAGCK